MKTIKLKLVLSTLLIVLIVLFTLSLLTVYLVSGNLESYIQNNNKTFASFIAGNVEQFIQKAYSLTNEAAEYADVKSFDPQKQKAVLTGMAERNPYFDLIYVQNTAGMQTARSSGNCGDRSGRWWFKKFMEDKKPFVSKSYYSLVGNVPVTSAFLPVNNDKSELVGILGSDIKLDALQEMIEKSNLGNGSYAYIIDGEGVVIAHPDKTQVSELYNYKTFEKDVLVKDSAGNVVKDDKGNQKTEKQKIEVPQTLKDITIKALNGETDVAEYKDSEGKTVISAYTGINLPGNSDKWAVITVQDKSKAMLVVSKIINGVLLLTLFLMLFAAGATYFRSQTISKPLVSIKDQFSKASKGDLTTRVDVKTKDEIGLVGESFNNMLQNIGDLIGEVKVSSGTVHDSCSSLYQIANENVRAINEISDAIGDIAENTQNQVHGIKKSEEKVHSLSASIEKVLDSTNHIDEVSETTKKLIEKGLGIVEELTVKSNESNKASNEINEIVQKMDHSSKEIGTITEAIGQISSQTNLLALNAAIEAARAGDHGRGFAVVADEIRTLAEKAAQSVKEIQKLIVSIQDESSAAVQAMNSTKHIIEQQNNSVAETRNIFKEISSITKTLMEKVIDIKVNNSEMSTMKNELVSVMNDISEASEHMSATTEEVSASSVEQLASFEEITKFINNLNELSEKLARSIEKFKID